MTKGPATLADMDTSLVVALVGVAGTLAGVGVALVAQARSENRTFRREELSRFHADRKQAYGVFLGHLNVRRKYAQDMRTYWDTPHFDRVRESAPDEGEWLERAQEIMAEIHLLGDAPIIVAATQLLAVSLAGPLILFAPFAPKPSREEINERSAAGEKMFREAYTECLKAMRASLNVPDPGDFYVF